MRKINVCISFDDNYAQYAGVTIASILYNAKASDELYFYLLDGGVSDENKNKLLSLKSIKDCEMNFVHIDEELFADYKKIKTHKYISLPTYFRLKSAELMPNVDKLIYLDCDTVVNTSLEELFNIDLEYNIIAGVNDLSHKAVKKNPSYINAGMILMDLNKIREQNIEEKFLEYTKNNIEKIKAGDQDIINSVLKGKIKLLNHKWNVQTSNFTNRSSYAKFPWIIHYVGQQKPWKYGNWNYHTEYYNKYLQLTPWALDKNEEKIYLKKSKIKGILGYVKYRPLFLFRPRFYQAFKETYLTKEPYIYPDTFFVWEPCSKSHSEVVPGFAKYLLDLGYSVSVLVTPDRLKEGLFSRFQNRRLFLNKMSQKEIKHYIHENMLSDAKGIMVTTVGKINDALDYSDAKKYFKLETGQKAVFVEHEVCHSVDNGTFWDKLITLRKIDYKGANSVVVNPHYFGDIKITTKNEGITNFITVGAIKEGKKNSDLIIQSVKKLHESGITNFKVTVVGKGSLKHIPSEIQKYFDIKGRLDFSDMYKELEKADFFLTAYEKDKPGHIRYITSGTSGNFQLVYGFGKPCIIVKEFGPINGFNEKNSILYNEDEDFADAMKKGILLSQEDYSNMQNDLLAYAQSLYNESLNNLRSLINE